MTNLRRVYVCLCAIAVLSMCLWSSVSLLAQSQTSSTMPRLVMYSGVAKDTSGKALSGTVGITFALYSAQEGGVPLWLETQNVQADSHGRFSVYLGATKPDGLPQDLFVSGEARWLGIQAQGQAEQPRAQLITVPYAMKAGDAETIGGLPPSAFVLAAPATISGTATSSTLSASGSSAPPPLAGSGTVNFVPLWTPDGNTLGNSVVFQSGTGSTAKIGVNTTTPSSTLDIKGGSTVRGTLSLPATGTATATGGKNSQVSLQTASSFNSGTNAAVSQNFRWMAEPSGNNTTSPSGTLNLLFNSGSNPPAETGLHVASNGQITFATGQTFPGTGNGTITGVTAGTDLTGGGTSGSVTLNVDTTKVPQLNAANTFTASQTVNGNLTASQLISNAAQGTAPLQVSSTTQVPNLNASFLAGLSAASFQPVGSYATLAGNSFSGDQSVSGNVTASGTVSGGIVTATTYEIGGLPTPFLSGSALNNNAFLGFSGNSTATGINNIASGPSALLADTSGSSNSAVGSTALTKNTTGSSNAAVGTGALGNNTQGGSNTAVGGVALSSNVTGSYNTGLGYGAGPDVNSPALTNATAVGAFAVVSKSNALVLGGTGANAVNVGIGTATPNSTLDVHGTANFTGPITFAAGQTFPGTGTITGVTAGTGLSGGGTTGAVTLSLNNTYTDGRYAQLAANNTYSGVQTINNSVGIGTSPNPAFALQTIGTIRSETGGLSVGGSAPVTVDAPFVGGGRFTILPNGNVGINNPNPTTNLDVNGNIDARGTLIGQSLNVAGGTLLNGTVTVGATFTTTAPARLASLVINNDQPMTAAPRMTFSGFFPGSLIVTAAGGFFTPSKGITLTRMTLSGGYASVCSPNGTISLVNPSNPFFPRIFSLDVTDGFGAGFSITDSGPISVPVAAGTPMMFWAPAGPDCGLLQGPNNIHVNVEYMMQ